MSQLDRLRRLLLGRTPGARSASVDNPASGTLPERCQGSRGRIPDPDRERLLERRARQRQADARYSEKRKAKRKQPLVDSRPAGVPSLSSRRVQELRDQYRDAEYWRFSKADIAAGKLDAWFREILRKELPPAFVEIEFERVKSGAL